MKAICELQGKQSIQKIAETLGISRNTVRRYLRDPDGAVARKPHLRRPSKLDPCKEHIMRRLDEGVDNCVVLLRVMWQRCQVYFMRNIMDACPKQAASKRFEGETEAYGRRSGPGDGS